MSTAAPIELRAVRKRYGHRTVLDGLDLRVAAGELVALLGVNGAGKELRARLGATLERGAVPRPLRAREAIRMFASFWRHPLDPDGLIERLGLASVAQTAYRDLSAGERQRLSLALALVGRPEVAVLDEPTAAMDVAVRRETWRIITELQDDGAAILLTTHILDEAVHLADRIDVLHSGRIVTSGPPAALAGGRIGVTARVLLDGPADPETLDALFADGLAVEPLDGNGAYRIRADDADAVVASLARRLPGSGRRIRSMSIGDDDLESLLPELTRDGAA